MNRLDASYFERLYRSDPDPWGFDTRFYERRKYALCLAALPKERYRRAFEPGCANGALSELLATRCDELWSSDFVASTLARARERLRRFEHVHVAQAPLPEGWPEGRFDLIVLSEVVYYLTEPGVHELLDRVVEHTTPDAQVLLVHYRGDTDYPLHGDECHAIFNAEPGLRRLCHYEEPSFQLDVFERALP